MDDDIAAHFKSVTGCADAAEASQFLEMCDGNLELAVNLYYQQLQPSSSKITSKENSLNTFPVSMGSTRHNASSSRYATSEASTPGPSHFRNDIETEDSSNSNSDDVRAPIAPVRGPIVEQTFAQQYNRQNGRFTTSVFETARDFRVEAEERLALLQNRRNVSDAATAKRMTLQALFRPPIDMMFMGDWDAVRLEAQQRGHWLLVNIQDDREFSCQTLNRDVWSNSSVKELIKSNFTFFQVHKDSTDGNRVSNYYRVRNYPSIFVVDPRTGEQLSVIRAKDAVSFCDHLTTFLDSYPDFQTRDQRLTDKPKCNDVEHSITEQNCNKVQHKEYCSNTETSRKRVHIIEDDIGDMRSIPKKARESNDKCDIESLIDGGSKLTTVDRDEWLKYTGQPDGRGCQIILSLRLPDCSRHQVVVEDTTTLRALFVLIAGLGFYPADYQFVLDYPKRIYTEEDHCRTLRELCFSKRELIHVERK